MEGTGEARGPCMVKGGGRATVGRRGHCRVRGGGPCQGVPVWLGDRVPCMGTSPVNRQIDRQTHMTKNIKVYLH